MENLQYYLVYQSTAIIKYNIFFEIIHPGPNIDDDTLLMGTPEVEYFFCP